MGLDEDLERFRAAFEDSGLVLRPPATEAEAAAAEAALGVALPIGYRRFLTEVANGIELDGELALFSLDEVLAEVARNANTPSGTFLYSADEAEAMKQGLRALRPGQTVLDVPAIVNAQKVGTPDGAIVIAFGDGNHFPLLVLTGAIAGEVWHTGELDVPWAPTFDTFLPYWASDMLGVELDAGD